MPFSVVVSLCHVYSPSSEFWYLLEILVCRDFFLVVVFVVILDIERDQLSVLFNHQSINRLVRIADSVLRIRY